MYLSGIISVTETISNECESFISFFCFFNNQLDLFLLRMKHNLWKETSEVKNQFKKNSLQNKSFQSSQYFKLVKYEFFGPEKLSTRPLRNGKIDKLIQISSFRQIKIKAYIHYKNKCSELAKIVKTSLEKNKNRN